MSARGPRTEAKVKALLEDVDGLVPGFVLPGPICEALIGLVKNSFTSDAKTPHIHYHSRYVLPFVFTWNFLYS